MIEECPAELRDQIVADTDISRDAEERLTTTAAVDYDTAPATPSTAGALAAVMMPGQPRDLGGVHEVHSAAVLGITSVLANESFTMTCCSRCKRQLEGDACVSHPEAAPEER